jgi:hypothetical protein
LEDPAHEPKEDMYMMSVAPENAPSEPEWVINLWSFCCSCYEKHVSFLVLLQYVAKLIAYAQLMNSPGIWRLALLLVCLFPSMGEISHQPPSLRS